MCVYTVCFSLFVLFLLAFQNTLMHVLRPPTNFYKLKFLRSLRIIRKFKFVRFKHLFSLLFFGEKSTVIPCYTLVEY